MPESMLLEIMRECKNFFVVSEETGTFEIFDGFIQLDKKYLKGQYIAIGRMTANSPGSILNAGIYRIIDDVYTLKRTPPVEDEVFSGSVFGLSIPVDFLELVKSIEAFQEKQGTPTNITSESFGVYSESRATGADGAPMGWSDVFRKQLNRYRRMFPDINI